MVKLLVSNKLINSLEDSLDFLIYAPYSVLRHIWIQLLIITLMFGLGTLIFMYYQGLDFLRVQFPQ